VSQLLKALRTRQPLGQLAAVAHYSAMAVEAAAIKANGVKGYRPQHGPNGGEMATTLDTLPVLVKYELTDDCGGGDLAEVTEVAINGHTLDAGNFAADIRAAWGSECMAARAALGL
jgi:hypothetical protein